MTPSRNVQRETGSPLNSAGHTLVELLVVLLLFALVIAAIYTVLRTQQRFYATHVQVSDTRDAARIASQVLSHELRGLSPPGGDLYAIAGDSVALRSATGFGVICGRSGNTLSLGRVSGVFGDLPTDSVLVFVEGNADTALDDEWRVAAIHGSDRGSVGRCADGGPLQLELVLDRELSGTEVGSPVRAFRPYTYRLYSGSDGKWWLGQRLRGGRLQPLAGPFAEPELGGLKLEALTASGEDATDLAEISQIRVSVTARSHRPVQRAMGPSFYHDSLSTVAYLRNGRR
jgi:type II secretory pathway pseudopilin PulG